MKNRIDRSVKLGKVKKTKRNIIIKENTYMNSGILQAGKNCLITIGKNCAIGYNVHMRTISHDPHNIKKQIEDHIVIGDNVWIGDNVVILCGINIGDHSIIGANTVVREDVPAYTLCAGVPGKLKKIYKDKIE